MAAYVHRVYEATNLLKHFRMTHLQRSENYDAVALSKLASSSKDGDTKAKLMGNFIRKKHQTSGGPLPRQVPHLDGSLGHTWLMVYFSQTSRRRIK